MTVLTVRHVTTYRYHQPVAFGEHRMMLQPRECADQRLLSSTIDILPRPSALHAAEDVFGNVIHRAQFAVTSAVLRFSSAMTIEHRPVDVPLLRLEPFAATLPFTYGSADAPDLARYMERQYLDPERKLDFWVRQMIDAEAPTLELLTRLNAAIHTHFGYRRRHEPGIQTPLETLRLGHGTCRDFAVLMIEAVRSLGLAARFVSGYLNIPPGEDGRLDGGNTHAWLQVFLPGAGWVDFDPTSGTLGNKDLIRVAVVRDPRQATPLSGSWYGSAASYIGMSVQVGVVESMPGQPGRVPA